MKGLKSHTERKKTFQKFPFPSGQVSASTKPTLALTAKCCSAFHSQTVAQGNPCLSSQMRALRSLPCAARPEGSPAESLLRPQGCARGPKGAERPPKGNICAPSTCGWENKTNQKKNKTKHPTSPDIIGISGSRRKRKHPRPAQNRRRTPRAIGGRRGARRGRRTAGGDRGY